MSDKSLPVQISKTDTEKLYELARTVEDLTTYDESVLDIIMEEADSLFGGDKTV